MGLAASQARLLTITARMHDVEYAAQNIMNQKIDLATQEDAAYSGDQWSVLGYQSQWGLSLISGKR